MTFICTWSDSISYDRTKFKRSDMFEPGLSGLPKEKCWQHHQKRVQCQRQPDAGSDRHGDCWIYTAIKSDTKLHLAHCTGKRVQETANALVARVKNLGKAPDKDDKATFVSDGNNQYTKALFKNFDVDAINYGQLVKKRDNGRVVGKTRTIIFGSLEVDEIEKVYVERYNLTLRHGISKRVRKSLCFSKCKEMLDDHLDLYQCYTNFIRNHSAFYDVSLDNVAMEQMFP